MVHGMGKIVWLGPEIIVMIASGLGSSGSKKFVQHVLLEVHEVGELCIVVVLDQMKCRWPVSRI